MAPSRAAALTSSLDDPIKSSLEADSAPARDRLWDWYRSDLLTRLRPGGRIVIVMTRWHPDDIGGRLLAGSDAWRTLRLPALAEPDDPLGRSEGQPLWPEWEGAEAINRKRLALGDRAFSALFQQSPTAPGGRLFRPDRITIRDDDPAGPSVRAWDLAASTRGNPDWTVGLRLIRTEQGFHVSDVVRLQGEPHAVEAAIRRTAELDGRTVSISLPQDPGQAGRHQATWLTGRLAGYRVDASPETGSKETRASPVASQVNAGNVSLARAAWNGPFLEELQDFPAGAKDDQVDALSRAFPSSQYSRPSPPRPHVPPRPLTGAPGTRNPHMVQLVMLFCLVANDASCIERRPVLDDLLSPITCIRAAQPIAARFVSEHPAYRLVSFKCEIGRRPERAA